jgi:DNA adenine methylase
VKSPVRWQGGKRQLAEAILSYAPAHQVYVETCCGGAAVFWAKPRSKAEILNDRDGDLINFYSQLHKRGRRLAAELDGLPYSRALFVQLLAQQPSSPFARAVRFWYLNRVAFGGRRHRPTFGVQATRGAFVLPPTVLASLDATIERLRGVLFESVDVVRLVDLYDRPSTFFYLDPPFFATSQDYVCRFGPEDHARLRQALGRVKGTWLLSYDDCPAVRRLYAGLPLARLSVRYTMGVNSSTGGADRAAELLISNRPLTLNPG